MAFIQSGDFKISGGDLSPVYLLAGNETYFIDKFLQEITAAVGADELNKEIFYLADSAASEILNALETLPFLSQKRLIIVKNMDEINSELEEENFEGLSNYVKNPNAASVLVLLCPNCKIVGKHPNKYPTPPKSALKEIFSACSKSKSSQAVNCMKLYENQVGAFIKNEFAKRKQSVSLEAVEMIKEENGQDLLQIANEIEKISLFAASKKNITNEDIEAIGGYTKEINAYTLASEIE
ncbi:MAG: DNA polymerase III subunit delta, partial [Endomicrobium sp.]|nr:DNA polymerase III subunit delta [Endomicrobium sp.]